MIAVEAPCPGNWVRGLATAVRSNGGVANDFSLHNADGALRDDDDDGKKKIDLLAHNNSAVYAQPHAAASGLQHKQRRRASIGNVFQRSASPPPPPAPQESNAAAEGGRGSGPRPRHCQGRRSTMDMMPSYDKRAYASAYGAPRDCDSVNSQENFDEEGAQSDSKFKRNRSVSGREHFEHIIAMEQEEEEAEQKGRREHKGKVPSFPWKQTAHHQEGTAHTTAPRQRSLADNIRDNFLRGRSDSNASGADEGASADPAASAAADPFTYSTSTQHNQPQCRRRVSNEDVQDVILNDDISWHNIRVEIRRARLVTSLGVADVCRSYVSSERGEEARRRIIKRRSMDHVLSSTSQDVSGGVESEGQAFASAAATETLQQQCGRNGARAGGGMRRRLSLF